ncbi:MAG: branched-chain amino acid ABC transporter permease [Archaeoglobaceae archaeon]|nr:branched-chain amino acid ABC transporter permease [Archaeoglobaceae archaeon]MDW8117954.1 branched-chain amino acid ABC transporter permease [Archaeoglobaceae archaeon]
MDVLSLIIAYTFVNGSLYLGMALGFTITTGVLRVFNLAYGAIFLIAIYGTWMFWNDLGLGLIESILLAILLVAAFTYTVYRLVILKFAELEDYMLAALVAVFVIVEELIGYSYPEIVGVYVPTMIYAELVPFGEASIPGQYLVTAFVSLAMLAIYLLFFIKTKNGFIMRAISQDMFASKLVGVNFTRTFALAMVIASIPPAIVMILISPIWALNPYIGWTVFTYAILVAVLGGLGNLKGSIMAAYVIGFIQASVGFLLDPRLMLLVSLIVVMIVLIVRPKGLARAETIW